MESETALLIIDLQAGMFDENDPVYQGGELLTKICNIITKAHAAQVPIFYIQHAGGEGHLLDPEGSGWPIHPAITPTTHDIIIHKHHPDSFQETELKSELEKRGIRHLVVTGIQTEYCIDTTCRRAYSLGYSVILVEDAHTTWDTERLTASQIISHHNQVLEGWFVKLKAESDLTLDLP